MGVKLLIIKDEKEHVDLPLVRFYGRLFSSIKWCPDESKFVFGVIPADNRIWRSPMGERRLLLVTVGERHAVPISMPRQNPSERFGWVTKDEIKNYLQ
jgi:hypothetical protein